LVDGAEDSPWKISSFVVKNFAYLPIERKGHPFETHPIIVGVVALQGVIGCLAGG
jgi:hypothetical protein